MKRPAVVLKSLENLRWPAAATVAAMLSALDSADRKLLREQFVFVKNRTKIMEACGYVIGRSRIGRNAQVVFVNTDASDEEQTAALLNLVDCLIKQGRRDGAEQAALIRGQS